MSDDARENDWPYPCIDHGIVDCSECEPWRDQQASDKAEIERVVAERDEAIRERDAAEFMRDQAEAAVAELAEVHEAMMNDWMSRESMTAAECVRRLIGERDAARKERDRARETAERATAMAERYGEAILAVGAALPNILKVRIVLAGLDSALDPAPSPEPPITGVTETQ